MTIPFMFRLSEYLKLGGYSGAMTAGIDVRDGTQRAFDRWLESLHRGKFQHRALCTVRNMSIEKECEQFAGKYIMVLGLLCGVIFVIGVLNFFNTSAVSILARKKELSLLEAVGMTKKQIGRMLSDGGQSLLFWCLC